MNLNDINKIMLGTNEIDKIYFGTKQIWTKYNNQIINEEGIPPLNFTSNNEGSFTNWRIYGNGDGSVTQAAHNLVPENVKIRQGTIAGDTTRTNRLCTEGYIPLQKSLGNEFVVTFNRLNPHTIYEFYYKAYDSNYNEIYSYRWWEGRGVGGEVYREYDFFSVDNSFPENYFVRFEFRESNNNDLTPSDITKLQVNYGRVVVPYTPPIDEISGVGNLVTNDRDVNFCKYKIPITVGGSTTNIYLDTPLITSNDVSDYIDYENQKRYNADGTQENIILPELSFTSGNNTFSVGTTIQPSKISFNT